jgi:hypothetical protein
MSNTPYPRKPSPSDVSDEEWAFVARWLSGLHFIAFACVPHASSADPCISSPQHALEARADIIAQVSGVLCAEAT